MPPRIFKRRYLWVAALLFSGSLLTACAASTPTPTPSMDSTTGVAQRVGGLPTGDVAAGQKLFAALGCTTCHALVADKSIVGPSLVGLGARAETRKPDFTASMYIYESILRPNVYVVDGFQKGLMPQTFETTLTPQQLADLLAFLLTQ